LQGRFLSVMKAVFKISFLTVLTALIVIISCQKSKNNTPEPPNNEKEYVTASLTGRILDDNKQPVSGAVVKAGSASATSDINGNFRINNISLDKNAGFIKVEKDGFFQGSRTIVVNEGVLNYISIQLIKRTVSGTVSGSGGGNITVQGGGSIVFTGNSFVNTAGNSAYTGPVSVSTFLLNPTASNFNEIMPGTLRGITTSNEETGLQSFGMMAVELTGAGGEKLQLAVGKTATLTFPIPTALQAQAPPTIPLWSFNDTTGLWKEEGTATKQGTSYVGTVGHFSFWNVDYPYGVVDFKAVIKDQNGNGVYPAQVSLKTTGDTVTSYGYGYTDSTGYVGGKIPKGKALQMKVLNKCNEVIYTKDIGPLSADADLGTITLAISSSTQYTFSGTVVNCTFNPVTTGFVDISVDSIHHRALVSNGTFSLTLTRCNGAPSTAVITPYDMGTNQNGTPVNVAVNSGAVNVGQLIACGNTINEFVNYTINGNSGNYIPTADTFYVSVASNGYFINISPQRPSRNRVSFDFNPTGTGKTPLIGLNIYYGARRYTRYGTVDLNITEFGAAGTGYIAGNFSDTLRDDSARLVDATFQFRIKRK
jgi:hypothetical protein